MGRAVPNGKLRIARTKRGSPLAYQMRYRFTRSVILEHAKVICLSPCFVCGRVMLRQAQHERLWAGHASTGSARTIVVGSCFDRLSNPTTTVRAEPVEACERLWSGHASTGSARTIVVGSCFDRLSTNGCGRVMLRQAQHERLWSGHASTSSARTVVVRTPRRRTNVNKTLTILNDERGRFA